MSRQRHCRPKSDTSDGTNGGKDAEQFNDVALIVGGKKILANGGILAFNSSVLGHMIESARKHRGAGKEELEDEGMAWGPKELVEVDLQNQSYSAIKTLMGVLQTKYKKSDSLSGETALQILPLTETFKMKRLRKLCAAAILGELETLRRGKRAGSIQNSIVLKYLVAADKYNMEKVKSLCVEECSVNSGVTHRKEIVDDKHISEKTKVAILDKTCDNMSATYDRNLRRMKDEMEQKCLEIEEKKKQHVEETEEWKKDFQKEVDDVIKEKQYRPLYEHLLEQFKDTEKYIDEIKKELIVLREQVSSAIQPIEAALATKNQEKSSVSATGETVLPIEAIGKAEDESKPGPVIDEAVVENLSEMKKTVEKSYRTCAENVAQIAKKATDYFIDAIKNFDVGLFQNDMATSYELQGRLDEFSSELDDRMQEIVEIKTLYEQEKIHHEKTKALLRKQMKKVHQINTWVKWAKPVDDDENRCTCFRHEAQKKLFQI